MNKTNIALLTIHASPNYGALFQCKASCDLLSKIGSVQVIDYKSSYLESNARLVRWPNAYTRVRSAVKDLLRLRARSKLLAKFERFRVEHLELVPIQTVTDRGEYHVRHDAYVSGSDQIWNPFCTTNSRRFDPNYFLTFAPENATKIALSTSMGAFRPAGEDAIQVKEWMQSFQAISVREAGTARFLSTLLEREVESLSDPTLLVDPAIWRSLATSWPGSNKSKYTLVYTVPRLKNLKVVAHSVSKRIGGELHVIDQAGHSFVPGSSVYADLGPNEFLAAFRDASFIVTDSFHGVCFALQFGKPFIAVTQQPYQVRIEELLARLGAKSRMTRGDSLLVDPNDQPDFSKDLAAFRAQADDFISRVAFH